MFKGNDGRRRTAYALAVAAVFGTGMLAAAQAEDIAREDTFIATGQTSAGSPTFGQYNDFNPFRPGLEVRSSISHVLEALYYYDVLEDKMIPWLATSYEYNDTYDSVTVHLRDGVTWNDGVPFTADDVAYTIDMLRKNGEGKKDMNLGVALDRDVKDVVKIDDHTLRIDLSGPNPRWFFTFLTVRFTEGMYIVPKHIYDTVDPNDLGSFTGLGKPGWPVGTGAFKVAEMTPERIILDRRDDWWGAKIGFHRLPAMKRVIFVPFTTHEQAAQLLTNGQVDTILEATVPVMKELLARGTTSRPSRARIRHMATSTGGRRRCSSSSWIRSGRTFVSARRLASTSISSRQWTTRMTAPPRLPVCLIRSTRRCCPTSRTCSRSSRRIASWNTIRRRPTH